jgi:hypothetical protein
MGNITAPEIKNTTKKTAKAAVRIGAIFLLIAVALVFLVRSGLRATTTVCGSGTPCVTTYGYDNARNNVNPNESVLSANTLFSTPPTVQVSGDLNGTVYGQPLYVKGLMVGNNPKNGLFVATEENWVYGLDADHIDSSSANLWTPLNLNTNVGANETALPDDELSTTCFTIPAEVGVTGTPVIDVDPNSKQPLLMYVVSKHYNHVTHAITQWLNAIDITAGTLKYSYKITGNLTNFSDQNQNQRAGLALMHDGIHDPLVVVTWGSHCDSPIDGYNGRVVVFELADFGSGIQFMPQGDFSTTPADTQDGDYPGRGGAWMSGAAPAIDGDGSSNSDVYLSVGNGSWDNTADKFGESALMLRLDLTTMKLEEKGFYTPGQWNILNGGSGNNCPSMGALHRPHPSNDDLCLPSGDWDFGSGGVTLAVPVGSSYQGPPTVMLSGGKSGIVYALSPTQMTNNGSADSNTSACTTSYAIDCITAIRLPNPISMLIPDSGDRCSMAFWDGPSTNSVNAIYVAGATDVSSADNTGQVRAWQMNSNGGFNTAPQFGTVNYPGISTGTPTPYPGACPVISWDHTSSTGRAHAILWILDTSKFQQAGQDTAGPVALYAYYAVPDPTTHAISMTGWAGDPTNGPGASKFMVPTVANGYVYVAGQKIGHNITCTDVLDGTGCLGQIVSWH